MTMHRWLSILAPALLLAACDPALRGECGDQADCPQGTACRAGLCVADGDGTCLSACPTDHHCQAAACVADFAPEVRIDAPVDGTLVTETSLRVRVLGRAAGGILSVRVGLDDNATVDAAVQSDGTWTATMDLSSAAITSGPHTLRAVLEPAGADPIESARVGILLDKDGPVVSPRPIAYPARTQGHPSVDAFLRNETVVIEASISDAPAGLATETPILEAEGLAPVAGESLGGGLFRFTFDARLPSFHEAIGDLAYTIRARDLAGHESVTTSAVRLSRIAWKWSSPTKKVRAAAAISGDKLFVGSDDGVVYALRRATGATVWTHDVGSPVVGHLTAGTSLVYATTEEGRVYGLQMADTSAARQSFRCPDNVQEDEVPLEMATGVALGSTLANQTPEETLFGITKAGLLRMFRRSPIVNQGGTIARGCLRGFTIGETNTRGVPALIQEGDVTVAYVGDAKGRLHRFEIPASGEIIQKAWTKSLSSTVGTSVTAPPTILPSVHGYNVAVALSNGTVQLVDASGNGVWQAPASMMTQSIDASPVADASDFALVASDGRAQKVATADGATERWSQDFMDGTTRGPDATASPVLAEDGRTYLAIGPRLTAIGTNGTAEWTYDTRETGTGLVSRYVDVATPTLSCDGILYLTASDTVTGTVLALITDSKELAHTGWPRSGHDNRHTFHAGTALPGDSCQD